MQKFVCGSFDFKDSTTDSAIADIVLPKDVLAKGVTGGIILIEFQQNTLKVRVDSILKSRKTMLDNQFGDFILIKAVVTLLEGHPCAKSSSKAS